MERSERTNISSSDLEWRRHNRSPKRDVVAICWRQGFASRPTWASLFAALGNWFELYRGF